MAAGGPSGTVSAAALAELCATYWYPLYVFVRRQGHPHHDAEDLTQAFFGRLLEKRVLGAADRERGRFRSFLLASVKHFLENDREFRNALKRGGGRAIVPIEGSVDERFERDPLARQEMSPDALFELRWARTVLDQALVALRESYAARDQSRVFDALKPCLTEGKGAVGYAAVAAELGLDEGAVKMAAHRLRQRYRVALREEIARTVASPDEVEDELRHLRAVLSGGCA